MANALGGYFRKVIKYVRGLYVHGPYIRVQLSTDDNDDEVDDGDDGSKAEAYYGNNSPDSSSSSGKRYAQQLSSSKSGCTDAFRDCLCR